MDAFYPSVEVLDNPALKGKPVIVGGNSKRGVVSSASYEARKFGVHSAQSIAQAMRLCPQGIFLPVRMARYKELSDRIFAIFHRFTPLVEPLSIDEAFLDITGTERLLGAPAAVAKLIKKTVFDETGLTVSAGVAPSKFVAKIASDINKPDGLTVVTSEGLTAFLDPLPVSRMWGAGKVTQDRLERYNIKTFRELRLFPAKTLERIFGKSGIRMQLMASGIDDREVTTVHEAKSIGHEETFLNDINDTETAERYLLELSMKTAERIRHMGLEARVIHLKVKYYDFTLATRSFTMDDYTDDGMTIYSTVRHLLEKTEFGTRAVRLLGVSVSGLEKHGLTGQISLFPTDEKKEKAMNLNRAIDSVNKRFGKKGIMPGRLLSD